MALNHARMPVPPLRQRQRNLQRTSLLAAQNEMNYYFASIDGFKGNFKLFLIENTLTVD